jgi:hypothetical protein
MVARLLIVELVFVLQKGRSREWWNESYVCIHVYKKTGCG